jgi:hypothetical protein
MRKRKRKFHGRRSSSHSIPWDEAIIQSHPIPLGALISTTTENLKFYKFKTRIVE